MQPWRWVHHRSAQSYHPRISYAYQESIVVILFLPSSYLWRCLRVYWPARAERTAFRAPSNAPKISVFLYTEDWKWWHPNALAHKWKNLARRQCGCAPRWNHCDEVLVRIRCVLCRTGTKWFYFWDGRYGAKEFLRHVLACISHHPPRVVVYWIITHFLKSIVLNDFLY